MLESDSVAEYSVVEMALRVMHDGRRLSNLDVVEGCLDRIVGLIARLLDCFVNVIQRRLSRTIAVLVFHIILAHHSLLCAKRGIGSC